MAKKKTRVTLRELPALTRILRKLDLDYERAMGAKSFAYDKSIDPEEKARKLFNLSEGVKFQDFLDEKLTEEEITILKKAMGL